MRQPRLKAPPNSFSPVAYYHCVSRVVNRDFVFGDEEREQFVEFMRLYERFCGVRVVTYCVMSNHFHLLVGVPKRPETMPSNVELIATVKASLGELEAARLEYDLGQAAKIASVQWEAEIRDRYLRRMWDISLFMKTLKQRFTQWFNRKHRRKGTLWEDRFRSVLVQAAGEPLAAMATYIDLNPIRANMVEDPKDYRWSGYGAAMGGDDMAVDGIREIGRAAKNIVAEGSGVLEAYRVMLYGRGVERGRAEDGTAIRKGFTREESRGVVESGGRLPRVDYLRLRVRYFTDGAVIGSREYVNEVFTSLRERFGVKRRTGARLLRGLVSEEKLYALRDLRVQPLS
jgi:REP element-mobilizing transposase RayT